MLALYWLIVAARMPRNPPWEGPLGAPVPIPRYDRLLLSAQTSVQPKCDLCWIETARIFCDVVFMMINEDHGTKRRKTMLTNSKIALSVALVLATASTAMAAPKKQAVRHQTTIQHQVPANAYMSFGAAAGSTTVRHSNEKLQDIGFKEYL